MLLSVKKVIGCLAVIAFIFATGLTLRASAQSASFTKCWESSTLPDLSITPAADEKRVYFVNVDGTLEAADLAGSAKLWSTELGGAVISNLLVVEQSLYVVSTAGTRENSDQGGPATLRSLSTQTGITNWSTPLPSASRVTIGTVGGNIVTVDASGSIDTFDTSDGKHIWGRNLDSGISGEPQFGSGEVVVATDKNEIIVVPANNGRTRVLSKTKFLPTAVMPDTPRRFLIGDDRGNIVFASSDGDRLWRFKNGAKISYLLKHDSEFVAASFDNFLYKLSRGGDVDWKRRLSGRVASRPLILGDTAVVSIVGDSSVYFIDLNDGKIANRIETGEEGIGGVATSAGRTGLVVAGSRGLTFYSTEKCPPK